MKIKKVLVANRGEIAVRILRTLRNMGISSVLVYHSADADSLAVREADEVFEIHNKVPVSAYLDVPGLLTAARETGAQAIHPGYGFLAENAEFAQAVIDAGLIFIGPSPDVIRLLGDKLRAREAVEKLGVPILPAVTEGSSGEVDLQRAGEIGFPVLIKAAAGGGGKGMRIARDPAQLETEIEAARREAERSFGDGRLYVERYVDRPRHIEVQILSDSHGQHFHLAERECSVQRRFQKIIEETPSPALNPEQREKICNAAVTLARGVGYLNAGTVEFILTPEGEFFFLEVNTRLQVEHPITEMVTGLDLVELQLRVADGEALSLRQEEIRTSGHAIECRVCAEDPANGYAPTVGKVALLRPPSGPGVRFDSGLCVGQEITPAFDSMLAKVIVHGADRNQAIARANHALRDLVLLGLTHNVAHLRKVLAHPVFIEGNIDTHFLDHNKSDLAPTPVNDKILPLLVGAASISRNEEKVGIPEPYASIGDWRN